MESRIEEVFAIALESEGEEREEFLADACGDDAEFRFEVQRMLVDAERAESLFGEVPGEGELEKGTEEQGWERAGDQIGPYLLREKLGEGGYGVVWNAEQLKPISRQVALKIVKAGMDTRQVLARFDAERQALALMDHPNIAKVFEAGTTEQGRPYFAMELIHGYRITDYCEESEMGTEDRLRLVMQACSAIQHAHQKGVVHRDIKPSNVLVTGIVGRPEVKVIDFGIAKAMGVALTERTLMTGTVEMMGTPEYMSPEQFAIDSNQVDSRTDVYSLGVLLFKLLTGDLPHEYGGKTIYNVARMVVEEPARRLGATSRLFRGDLDTIVGKALQKDPDLRYATASEFASDLQSFLDREPITARRAGTLYQLKLFTRRNKALVGGVLGTIAALVVGIVLALLAFNEAKRERRVAEDQVYQSSLMAASRSFETGDQEEALTHLKRVPSHLRDWIWDLLAAQVEEPLLRFRGRGVVFADERTLRTVTRWGIEEWDVFTGERRLTVEFAEEQAKIGALFTRDGALVLTHAKPFDDPYLYRVLDAATGEEVSTFSAKTVRATLGSGTVLGVGNRRVAFRHTWLGIQTCELRSGEILPPISREAAVHELTPDENYLALSNKWKGLMLYDVRTGELAAGFLPMDYVPSYLAFGPDGQSFATIEGNQKNQPSSLYPEVRIWDRATRSPVHDHNIRLPGQAERPIYDPTGTLLAIPVQQDVLLVDVENLQIVRTLSGLPDTMKVVSFSRDGKMVAATDTMAQDRGEDVFDENNGIVWWSRDPNVLRGHKSSVHSVTFSPDGQRIASGSWESLAGEGECIRIWDAETGKEVGAFGGAWIVDSLHFTPDGSKLVTFGRDWDAKRNRANEVAIRIWDPATGHLLSKIEKPLRDGTVSPDGKLLAGLLKLGVFKGVLALVDLETGEVREGPPCQMVYKNPRPPFSPDHKLIVSAAPDHSILISEVASLEPLLSLMGHTDEVTSIAFSKGGEELLTASTDDTVRLWNVETGEEICTLTGPHTDAEIALFSPEGSHILSGGGDGKVRIWNVAKRQVVAELTGHQDSVQALAISPDGQTIVSGSADRTLRLWGKTTRDQRRKAIAQREELVKELTPLVEAKFDELGDASAVVEHLRETLEERRREVALQIALGEALAGRPQKD